MTPASIVIFCLLATNVLTGGLWLNSRTEAANSRTELAQLRADTAEAVATAHRENAREFSRLVTANQEIQIEYNATKDALDRYRRDGVRTERVRESERAAIVAAASRAAADTCGRYAERAERNIAGVEADADSMGRRAVREAAIAKALNRTLSERRAALDAKRQTLKPPKEKP